MGFKLKGGTEHYFIQKVLRKTSLYCSEDDVFSLSSFSCLPSPSVSHLRSPKGPTRPRWGSLDSEWWSSRWYVPKLPPWFLFLPGGFSCLVGILDRIFILSLFLLENLTPMYEKDRDFHYKGRLPHPRH